MLGFILLFLGVGSFWLFTLQVRDFRRRDGDFSEWITSDATEFNRRVWYANAWLQMVGLFVAGVVGLIGAWQLLLVS